MKIVIPSPLQIVMDDLGWFCGKDARGKMEPARTGITRRHCAEDYEVVNEIGKRLGMRINCAMIMGEWDPDNRLRSIPALSVYGDKWDNASFFDKEEAKRCADVINSSDFIDIAIHGIQHSYYRPNSPYSNSDYYYREGDGWTAAPDSEIRARLDAWYDLIEYHGIQKNVDSFVPPNFTYEFDHISRLLKPYGIRYISTVFRNMPGIDVQIEDGIITVDRNNNLIPFNEMESDPNALESVSGIFGCHWANVCYNDPKENCKAVDNWVNYFQRCGEEFGIILSEGMSFCATQTVYKAYSKLSVCDNKCVIDLSGLPNADGLGGDFYISTAEPLTSLEGCDAEVYEKRKGFINYKITPRASVITLGA